MRCEEVQDRLIEYENHSLTLQGHEAISEHLQGCSHCQEKWEIVRTLRETLKREEFPDPGEAYWQGFSSRVRRRLEESYAPVSIFSSLSFMKIGAVAAILLLLSSFLVNHFLSISEREKVALERGRSLQIRPTVIAERESGSEPLLALLAAGGEGSFHIEDLLSISHLPDIEDAFFSFFRQRIFSADSKMIDFLKHIDLYQELNGLGVDTDFEAIFTKG